MARKRSTKAETEGVPRNNLSAGDDNRGARQAAGNEFLVVGIGASAGGIQALTAFFENVPDRSGVAYVVILHLSPSHESRLAEILQRSTPMPVTQVTAKTEIEPDHVYVVPPNRSLSIVGRVISVAPVKSVAERRAPVDIFFRSLADAAGARAVAVILSGTGANGSMGLKRIKEFGGVAFVQDPNEAEYGEMPRNSIATDLADSVLPVREIPRRIVEYKESLGLVQIPSTLADGDQHLRAMAEIFLQLSVRTGHDFTSYKRPTVHRRIERRIRVTRAVDLPSYAAMLDDHPEEVHALLKDLLISVTNFFRDKKAWDGLEQEVIRPIIKNKRNGEPIRAWVVGCATGEEAYSLAMLLEEAIDGMISPPSIQIFATDIDEQAVAAAREGLYTLNDAADVPPERLARFFTEEGGLFRVKPQIREKILFAKHNVIKAPPFSRLDLVTCRNVLIYLNSAAQERVIETLHFALNPGGFLFVGSSESMDGMGDMFAPVNKENRIYESRQANRKFPMPDSVAPFTFVGPEAERPNARPPAERLTFGDVHLRLLEEYAPPSVLVNEEYDILHLSENAGQYLRVVGGEPSNNLLKLVLPDLRLELRTSLLQAAQRRTNVEIKGVKPDFDGVKLINLHVRPVTDEHDPARGFFLVIFEPIDIEPVPEQIIPPDSVARHLEEELSRTKEQLRAALDEADRQTEELRASNEELQAMNEELRSTAEELETGKEELQSINEELTTVNQELKVKIDELSNANNDFENLINSTDIGTMFLDRSFRVRFFSPAIASIFNLRHSDLGRPLTDITHRLKYDYLLMDAETVLKKLTPVEREITSDAGAIYILRVVPYRTSGEVINGVVMNFVDVSAVSRAERHYRDLFDSINEGLCVVEILRDKEGAAIDYRFLEVNPAFEQQTGFHNVVGRTVKQVMPQLADEWFTQYGDVSATGRPARFETFSDIEGHRWFEVYAYRYGEPERDQIAMLCKDISERKRRELNLAVRAQVNDEFE